MLALKLLISLSFSPPTTSSEVNYLTYRCDYFLLSPLSSDYISWPPDATSSNIILSKPLRYTYLNFTASDCLLFRDILHHFNQDDGSSLFSSSNPCYFSGRHSSPLLVHSVCHLPVSRRKNCGKEGAYWPLPPFFIKSVFYFFDERMNL